jgi:hypothetical protein
MRLRKTLLGTFVLLAVALLSGAIGSRQPTLAAEFTCQTQTCVNPSKCSGDHFNRSGCSITCYKDQGSVGEVVWSGSANCSTTPPAGGGGGGGGTEGGGCWSDWDCAAGESCDQGSGTCQEYGGGYGGLMP